ncbi:MAG: hypothetical protein ACI84K_001192 [Pseudohongiellaceae bacterium]|jgi:hypothetical protein
MFNQLISLTNPKNQRGILYSVRSGHYIAVHVDQEDHVIKQAPKSFRSLSSAKYWFKKRGIHTISLRCTPAYFEMIGLSP